MAAVRQAFTAAVVLCLASLSKAGDVQAMQRLDDNEHTYVGRDFPPPTLAHLSARLVPTQLQPLLLLSVSSDLRYASLKDTAFTRRSGPGQPVTLRVVANVSTEAACNQLCLQERPPGAAAADSSNTTCTAWQFCGDVPGGCPSSEAAFSLGRLTCQLMHMPRSAPGFSEAPCLADGCQAVAANRSVAGAPVRLEGAQMPGLAGYARYPAVDAPARADFAAGCPASANLSAHNLTANPGTSCWVNGTLADVAVACSAVPECDFLVYYPRGRSPRPNQADRPSGVLKTARALGNASRLQPGVGELLRPRDYDARYALNPLAVSYFKYQTLLEASAIKPSALNASQRIAVIEVRNLTGDASQAGADLRADLHVHVQPPPRRVRLSEAAPTCHTHAQAAQALAPAVPLPAALVVINMTFSSPGDADLAETVLNASLAALPSHGAPGRSVGLLYLTRQARLPVSAPVKASQPARI